MTPAAAARKRGTKAPPAKAKKTIPAKQGKRRSRS
jgi:hypothetical protein